MVDINYFKITPMRQILAVNYLVNSAGAHAGEDLPSSSAGSPTPLACPDENIGSLSTL